MENKEKKGLKVFQSESEKLQDELEPIYWLSTEHDESDDIEDAKKTTEARKKEKDKFLKDFLSDKELADNLQKISNHKKK